ncbi:PAS domain-containing protein [Clostridium sp. CF011]|uniref:ATP-binding protein n=1 Tax=Clostridium sp. CF011 TaxID=2843318 RepID=UPI001C0BE5F2|nr:ATP-binding protein [Clostridium sp. CF011]MBU3091848.1 PAS domain-containing protein [Clostridium sp. CF011]WAG68253.1 PAS domain-containing protein [Clostridium sp. CF011]
MGNIFNSRIIEPYFYCSGSILTEVNQGFLDFTGYSLDELLGKSLIEIGEMLKINSQIFLDSIISEYSGYIFTKSLSAREVNISLFHDTEANIKKYTFVEELNSRLDEKLIFVEQIFVDEISGAAVYSLPDLILLRANQTYLNLLDSPFNKEENSIGRSIKEILTGFAGSQVEAIWNNVLVSQKTRYINEVRFDEFARGTTYWESTQMPIYENRKMKYRFVTANDITERVLKNKSIKRQNKILEQQKEKLEQLEQQNIQLISVIENLSEGVMFADNKGEVIMVNAEAKRLVCQSDIGITLGDAYKNTKAFDMKGKEIPFENFPSVRALRGERIKNIKIFVCHPNKEYFAEISSIPIYNASGELTMIVSCFHDITETIKQSRKIEEQKKELEAIIENISDSIAIFDNKERYVLINKASREMFFQSYNCMENIVDGYKTSEFYDAFGEKIETENIPSHRVMRGEKFKNMRLIVKSPYKTLQLDVSGTPIYDLEGKFTLGVICSKDMTTYLKHEEAIRSRYEFLNRMVNTFDLPLVRLSCPDLMIVDINKKAFSIIKLLRPTVKSMEQIKNNGIEGLFKTLETREYYQCIGEVLKEKKIKYLNKKNLLINGNEVYWNIIFEPMIELNGEVREILILIIDVTNEIKSNMIMEKALKLQGEFLVNISHELKTPLNVIFATAQLFNMYCNSGSLDEKKDSIIKYIESIKQNSYRLSKIINNIVDLSKIEAGFFKLNLSNNNIVEVVEEIVMSVTALTESKGLNIIFDTDIEEKIIACDTEKVERIALNLISNAIKFSDEGDEIFVDIKDMNEYVEISVRDNGIGIEEEHLDMIFDRFKQVDKSLSRNAEGTGIGLSLVKSIVGLHGGNIYVESKFGKGSKFTVVLPSKKVLHENMIYSSNVRSKNESIQVELSDIYS